MSVGEALAPLDLEPEQFRLARGRVYGMLAKRNPAARKLLASGGVVRHESGERTYSVTPEGVAEVQALARKVLANYRGQAARDAATNPARSPNGADEERTYTLAEVAAFVADTPDERELVTRELRAALAEPPPPVAALVASGLIRADGGGYRVDARAVEPLLEAAGDASTAAGGDQGAEPVRATSLKLSLPEALLHLAQRAGVAPAFSGLTLDLPQTLQRVAAALLGEAKGEPPLGITLLMLAARFRAEPVMEEADPLKLDLERTLVNIAVAA